MVGGQRTGIHSLIRTQDGEQFLNGRMIAFNHFFFLNKIHYLRDTVGSDYMISVVIGKFITHLSNMHQEKETTDSWETAN